MEYKSDEGKVYEISYSQKMQAEDLKLKKSIIAIGFCGLALLAILAVLLTMLISGGTITKILHNVVC
jgi:hypothetical protein